MHLLISVICFLIFLYYLHLLCKDDYLLIRKNFLLDHVFDLAFIGAFTGLIVGRILTVLIHPVEGSSFVIQLLSLNRPSLTLPLLVISSIFTFYLIMRLRKLPAAHLYDFLSFAFLGTLPVYYLLNLFFVNRQDLIYSLAYGIIFLLCLVLFWRLFLPKVVSNKLKEGSMGSTIFIAFSLISLIGSFAYKLSVFKISPEDIVLLIILVFSVIFLIKNESRQLFKVRKHV